MEVERQAQQQTSVTVPNDLSDAPLNQLGSDSQLNSPQPGHQVFVQPNVDTLYTMGHLNLASAPIVLHVPRIANHRYYVFQFLDPYTNTFAYVGTHDRRRSRQLPDHRAGLARPSPEGTASDQAEPRPGLAVRADARQRPARRRGRPPDPAAVPADPARAAPPTRPEVEAAEPPKGDQNGNQSTGSDRSRVLHEARRIPEAEPAANRRRPRAGGARRGRDRAGPGSGQGRVECISAHRPGRVGG